MDNFKTTYLKNSTTGQLIKKMEYIGGAIKNVPTYYFDHNNKSIDIPNIIGFVEIKEKKFKSECRKILNFQK